MDYQCFDPNECGFPKPRVPILPTLSSQSLGRARLGPFIPLGFSANARIFARGRYALTEAYRQSGVGEHGALLAPAYHCRTMLDPAIRLGAKVLLYDLNPDLSPNLASLTANLSACHQPVKALLVTHYFGFSQALEPLTAFCEKHEIDLIEDCSHALFTKSTPGALARKGAMGQTGRYGVASPYKFFACEDGGLLWCNADEQLPDDHEYAPTLTQELRGFLHSAQRAFAKNKVLNIDLIDAEIKALTDKLSLTGRDERKQATEPSTHYVAAEEHLKSLAWSRWVMRHTHVERLANRRRENYQKWTNAVVNLPHCRALFPYLPDDCVPYMFPLKIDHPEIHFLALKQLGVPVWRWDDMAVSTCPVASDYRLKVLHLPCHQELTEDHMHWMSTALKKVLLELPATTQ